MPHDTNSLAALIGSRICHDLISPIGAVTNGLELLELSGTAKGPELALVAESVASASARIQFFRLAFGVASPGQMTSGAEVASILAALYADGRISVNGFPPGDHPRPLVRALLLALLCAEQAVPFGGEIDISGQDRNWSVTARGSRLSPDQALWAMLEGANVNISLPPGAVQFLMLPVALQDLNLKCSHQISDLTCEIRITPA